MSAEAPESKPRIKSHWEKIRDMIEDPTSTGKDLRQILGSVSVNSNFPSRFPFHTKPTKSGHHTYLTIQGPTILQIIILNERPDLLQYLFDSRRGPDPLQKSRDGNYNAVHVASMTYDTSCLEILLKCESVQKHIEEPIRVDDVIKPAKPIEGAGTNSLHLAVSYDLPRTVVLLTQKHFPKPIYGYPTEGQERAEPNGQYPLGEYTSINVHIEFSTNNVGSDDSDVEDEPVMDNEPSDQNLNSGIPIDSLNMLSSTSLFDAILGSKARLTFLLLTLGASLEYHKQGSSDDTNCIVPEHLTAPEILDCNLDDGRKLWPENDQRKRIHFEKIFKFFGDLELDESKRFPSDILLSILTENDYCPKFEEILRKKIRTYFKKEVSDLHQVQNTDVDGLKERIRKLQEEIGKLQNKIDDLRAHQNGPSKNGGQIPPPQPNKCCVPGCKFNASKCNRCDNFYCNKHINTIEHTNNCH